MKLVVLTSNGLRHKFVVSKLVENFDVQLIVSEQKSATIEDTNIYNLRDAKFVRDHFEKRNNSENKYFGTYDKFPEKIPLLNVSHKEINNSFVFEEINLINPEVIVLFGTSIIKNHVLNRYQGRVINLHLGLSPYYKGSATNLFPFFYKEMECIGATIHIATEKVDTGAIIHQYRPVIDLNDDMHDIGNKVILKSGQELPKVIREFLVENLEPIKQQSFRSKICKINDVTPAMLREIYENFKSGIVEEYLKNEKSLCKDKPIIKR
jgi:folate-dependent phosphoribosylglycinamide formyltransferase PurN